MDSDTLQAYRICCTVLSTMLLMATNKVPESRQKEVMMETMSKIEELIVENMSMASGLAEETLRDMFKDIKGVNWDYRSLQGGEEYSD